MTQALQSYSQGRWQNGAGEQRLQINAFNFPVWGMLEKLAPAFLAGMPSVVKPTTLRAKLGRAHLRLRDRQRTGHR